MGSEGLPSDVPNTSAWRDGWQPPSSKKPRPMTGADRHPPKRCVRLGVDTLGLLIS